MHLFVSLFEISLFVIIEIEQIDAQIMLVILLPAG